MGWGSDISDDRRRELLARLTAWEAQPGNERRHLALGVDRLMPDHEDCEEAYRHWDELRTDGGPLGPFDSKGIQSHVVGPRSGFDAMRTVVGEPIHLSSDDVFWIAARARAGPTGDIEKAKRELRNGPNPYFDLFDARFEGASISKEDLGGATLDWASFRGADLFDTSLVEAAVRGASFADACLENADLRYATACNADFTRTCLQEARLQGTDLSEADLTLADLRSAVLDGSTKLNGAALRGVYLDQTDLGRVNLAVVDWDAIDRLGDEVEAEQSTPIFAEDRFGYQKAPVGFRKTASRRLSEYAAAARAYTTLAIALRSQGLSREAGRFHYRAEVTARRASFYRAKDAKRRKEWNDAAKYYLSWAGSLVLAGVSGYGERMARIALWYIGVVVGFAALFYVATGAKLNVTGVLNMLALSVTAFHGRGFAPSTIVFSGLVVWCAALESVFGLLIEALFIAAFTRRVLRG